eukprot:GHVU01022021.1.p3 GENE.GHVU01022021.1~~GHVU01022021.1.p3  ORF type:complete len:104 (+),score=6.39 GHVU01022021.1:1574-1885(+)
MMTVVGRSADSDKYWRNEKYRGHRDGDRPNFPHRAGTELVAQEVVNVDAAEYEAAEGKRSVATRKRHPAPIEHMLVSIAADGYRGKVRSGISVRKASGEIVRP